MSTALPLPEEPLADAPVSPEYRQLRSLLEQGLPLTPRPWQSLARACGLSEDEVIACVRLWRDEGLIKRTGLVVRHRNLGIQANAMVVWDVPDESVQLVGQRLAEEPAVTLCYQRPRRLPDWPWNLFSMIHGTRRDQVRDQLTAIRARQGLESLAYQVLFSTRAYRQCGGRYAREGTT